jgi:predicted DNA binding protein/ActR/RegA family two-component response regulator
MVDNTQTRASSQSLSASVDVLLVDDDEQWARVTARLLEATEEAIAVTVANSLAEGRARFEAGDPACVICDYQLGDGTGLDLLETVREADPDQPFVLVTGRGDETVASDAIGRGVTDYIPKEYDDADSLVLANRVTNAIVSSQAQRQLDRERQGKATTLDILTSTTSMADLLPEFCRVLVEDHGYGGAWIGAVKNGSDSGVVPQAVAGCDAYLDAVASSGAVTPDSPDPVIRAVERDEPIVVSLTGSKKADTNSVPERYSDAADDWKQLAEDHGFVTAAGIPIRHDGIREGVLGIYCTTHDPLFDITQWKLLEEYARIIGYAYQTAKLKRSLLSDQSVRVDIEIRDTTVPLAEFTEQLGTSVSVEVLSTIKQADSATLYLAQVPETSSETVRTAVERCESIDLHSITQSGDGVRCDLLTTAQTPEDVLAAHGTRVERTVGASGTVTISMSVSDHGVVSTVTEALRNEYDNVTITTLWNQYDGQTPDPTHDPLSLLTEKQQAVLSHAYFDGYFEQPRDVSSTELAEKFDVSRPTMTQHMRAAQRKLFGQLFDQ